MLYLSRLATKAVWLIAEYAALSLALVANGQGVLLTNVSQVHALTLAEAASGLPVKLTATVNCYVPPWGGLFVQDDTGAAWVEHKPAQNGPGMELGPGTLIEVTGITHPGIVHANIAEESMRILGHGLLPAALEITDRNTLSLDNETRRVHAIGRISNVESVGGLVALELSNPDGQFLKVMVADAKAEEAQAFKGSSVEFTGVLALDLTPDLKPSGAYNMVVSKLSDIHRVNSIPVTRPESAAVVLPHRVLPQKIPVLNPTDTNTPVSANPALKTLDQIAEIRSLSPSQAKLGYPVHVQGVVTYEEPEAQLNFVQDYSAGIYFAMAAGHSGTLPPAGTRIELWGFSSPGEFAPVLSVEKMRVVGRGQYPNPYPFQYQVLLTGAGDAQWVALRGVVHSLKFAGSETLLGLAIGDTVMPVKIMDGSNAAPPYLLGAGIEVNGVCQSLFDEHRRFKELGFCVPGWDAVKVKEAGPSDAFQLPRQLINELFQFKDEDYGTRRSRVEGRIILRQRNGALFVQDRVRWHFLVEKANHANWLDMARGLAGSVDCRQSERVVAACASGASAEGEGRGRWLSAFKEDRLPVFTGRHRPSVNQNRGLARIGIDIDPGLRAHDRSAERHPGEFGRACGQQRLGVGGIGFDRGIRPAGD